MLPATHSLKKKVESCTQLQKNINLEKLLQLCNLPSESSSSLSAVNIPPQAITRQTDIRNMQLNKNLALLKNSCINMQFYNANTRTAHRLLFCISINRKTPVSGKWKIYAYRRTTLSIHYFSMMNIVTRMILKVFFLKKGNKNSVRISLDSNKLFLLPSSKCLQNWQDFVTNSNKTASFSHFFRDLHH